MKDRLHFFFTLLSVCVVPPKNKVTEIYTFPLPVCVCVSSQDNCVQSKFKKHISLNVVHSLNITIKKKESS